MQAVLCVTGASIAILRGRSSDFCMMSIILKSARRPTDFAVKSRSYSAGRARPGSGREELQRLAHERLLILKNAAVPGVLVEHEFRIRQTPREIDRIEAG